MLVGLGLGFAWWRTRKRGYLIGLAVAVIVLAGVLLANRLIDTDAKQIERALQAMAEGVGKRDAELIFRNFSDQFTFDGRLNKAAFKERAVGHMNRGDVTSIEIWDYEPVEILRPQRTATVIFRVKGKGSRFQGFENFYCKAFFVLDPDNRWRMKDFRLYPPQTDPRVGEPLHVPI